MTAFVTTRRPGECFRLTRRSSSEPLSLGGRWANRGLGRGNALCGRGDADGRLGWGVAKIAGLRGGCGVPGFDLDLASVFGRGKDVAAFSADLDGLEGGNLADRG